MFERLYLSIQRVRGSISWEEFVKAIRPREGRNTDIFMWHEIYQQISSPNPYALRRPLGTTRWRGPNKCAHKRVYHPKLGDDYDVNDHLFQSWGYVWQEPRHRLSVQESEAPLIDELSVSDNAIDW